MPSILLTFLGAAGRWLLAGMAGRILLSAVMQGAVVAGSLFYSGEIADWAFNRLSGFVRSTSLFEVFTQAFSWFGNLPSYVLQLWGCFGFREAIVALIAGQISTFGVALIMRKLL